VQHLVGKALIAGLCGAAFVACFALLGDDFDEGHARVIGTSLGFSVFTAFAGAGDALRARCDGWREVVGTATLGAAVLAFVLLLAAIWIDIDSAGLWQAWGITALLALCGSHASLVLRAERPTDTPMIGALVIASIATACINTAIGVMAIAELFEDVDEGWGRVAAIVLILWLLFTALPPLMRRFGEAAPAAERDGARHAAPAAEPDPERDGARREPFTLRALADEVADAADRLERIEGKADAKREAATLRDLATRARG
jgi:hypothetical protein